jgi:hypothetical protein
MTPDRMDDLLDRALELGRVPADATEEERVELERLLAAAGALQAVRTDIDEEARAAKPVARARFERAIGNVAPPTPVRAAAPKRRNGFAFGFGAIAAAIAVLVVAVVAIQPFGGTQTASALSIDDYVQVPGVVTATAEGSVTVTSPEFGDMEVLVSDLTSVVDGETPAELQNVEAGESVLVSGLVRRAEANRVQIDARTLALAVRQPVATERVRIDELRNFREGVAGTISVLVLSPDGASARVLIETEAGRRVLVNVSLDSVERLLEIDGSPVGLQVRIEPGEGLPAGVFVVVAVEGQPPAEPGSGLVTVGGVIMERRANVFQVRTERGIVRAVVRPSTRILLGRSGLTLEGIRDGESAIGHTVRVTGGLEPGTNRIIVDIAVVGPKLE